MQIAIVKLLQPNDNRSLEIRLSWGRGKWLWIEGQNRALGFVWQYSDGTKASWARWDKAKA